MRITNIKVQGFKSFNNEEEILFPEGMTAIVGPNGCGKSNIVDAIRWVLGEQSPKRLRGKSMEEVLFSGTEHFTSANMARVALQFSRKKRGFPHPYSGFEELSVERLLFRSGESEYRINQNPVRLKDVVDLFMDTGAGTRSFSVIEQGYIGEIISAGPERRRFFIEGAAGISKYKARKNSAMRKMEATKENLRHIEAILSEIRRHMNSLNRQAQKARRYNRIRDEIRQIECSLAVRAWRGLLRGEQEAGTKKEEQEKRNAWLLSELSGEEAGIEGINTELIQIKNDAEQKQAEFWKYDREMNQGENRQIYLNQSREDLGGKIESNKIHVAMTQEQLFQTEKEAEELARKIDEVSRRGTWVEESLHEMRQKNQVFVSRERDLQDGIEEVKEGIFACMTQKAELHNKQLTLKEKNKDLEHRREKNIAEIGGIQRENKELLEKRSELEKAAEDWKRKRGFLLLERTALEVHEKELRGEFNTLTERVDKVSESLNMKRSRLRSLQEFHEGYEGCHDGVKAIMQRREDEECLKGGIRGMFADFIETEPEYEAALESVLGDRLQCIVVEEQQDGLQAIQYLKSGTLGRGSFIPLHLRGDSPDREPVESPAVPLLDIVKTKDDYNEITEYLLGDVVFVPDLNQGLALWNKNGSQRRIVTGDGDLIDPHGMVSGGRTNGSSSTILKTKREIRTLQEEIQVLEEEYDGLRERSEVLLRKIRFAEMDVETLQQNLVRFDMEILKGEKDLQQVSENLGRNQQRLETLEAETVQFENELQGWQDKEEAYTDQQQELGLLQEEKESLLSRLNREMEEWTVDRELQRDELNKMEIEVQLLREKRQSLALSKDQVERKLGDIRRDLSEKIEEGQEAEAQLLSIVEEIETTEGRIKELELVKGELETLLSGLNEKIQEQTSILQEKGEKVKGLQRDQDEVRQSMDSIQIKLVEIELKKENLQGQIWEKHRLDISTEQDLEIPPDIEEGEYREKLDKLQVALQKMGEINPSAIEEFEEQQERHQFYDSQYKDLSNTLESLQRLIQRINRITKSRFLEAFHGINKQFQDVFPVLFNGGKGFLQLDDEKDPLESGVDIVAQPPGKRLQNINLLSGGEKTMAALSLIMAIFKYKPSPFCVLDEVDAALDDANVIRFNEVLKDISGEAQFILITHNKQTMEIASTLYGITMQYPGVSQVVSVNMN